MTVGRDGPRIHEVGNSPILRTRRLLGAADDALESLGQLQAFMSPQVLAASHDPSPADDIFSLGAIMHLLLTGLPVMGQEDRHRLILGGSVAEVLCDVRKNNILVPPRLAAAIAKAVRFSVHDRFDNVAQLGEQIRLCQWPDDTVNAIVDDAVEIFPAGAGADELIKACDLLKLALQIDPGNPAAHQARGLVYLRDDSYSFAIEELTRAVMVAPTPVALDLLAQAYERQGEDREKAVGAYERALQHGDDPMILERLARLLQKMGRPRRAGRVLQRAVDCEADESLRQRRLLLLEQWCNVEGSPAGQDRNAPQDHNPKQAETADSGDTHPDNVDVPDHEP